MVRYGFGEKTGESEKGGLTQYEHGHVQVSGQAFRYAAEAYPSEPPAVAVGKLLIEQFGSASDADNSEAEE